MRKFTANNGYPIDPVFRVPINPLNARVKPLPLAATNNPGEFFSGNVSNTLSTVTVFSTNVVFDGTQYNCPGEDVHFLDPLGKQYNCLEIDMLTRKSNNGWCVPDFIGLTLDSLSVDNFVKEYPRVVPNAPYLTGRPFVASELLSHRDSAIDLCRYDWFVQPTRQYLQPITGDSATSVVPYSGPLFRLQSPKLFRSARITSWARYDQQGSTPYFGYGLRPSYTFRVWYDPAIAVVKS